MNNERIIFTATKEHNLIREAAGDSPLASSIRPLPLERAVWNELYTVMLFIQRMLHSISSKSIVLPYGKYRGWPTPLPPTGRRPKFDLDQDRPKNQSKIDQNFDRFSVSVLDRFGVVLGPQLGVIFGQISYPNRLGTGFTSKTSMSTK